MACCWAIFLIGTFLYRVMVKCSRLQGGPLLLGSSSDLVSPITRPGSVLDPAEHPRRPGGCRPPHGPAATKRTTGHAV